VTFPFVPIVGIFFKEVTWKEANQNALFLLLEQILSATAILATVCGRWDLTASEVPSLCIANPCIIHLLSTATAQSKYHHFQVEMHSGKSICSYRQKKTVSFIDFCAKFCFDHGWLISPSTFCLPVVGSLHRVSIWSRSAATTLEEEGGKSPSVSGNRRLY